MDVIANNISNVNTTGFKSSRVTFAEIFAQALRGASSSNETTGRGGVNPMQIGLGATVAGIDLQMNTGAAQRTDNPFDLMIQGSGFFIVGDDSGLKFTRAGAFNFDESGNLVNSSGLKVYGWSRTMNEDGEYVAERGQVTPISITQEMRQAPPMATTKIEFSENLNAAENRTEPHSCTMTFYDSLGHRYVTEVSFAFNEEASGTDSSTWDVTIKPEMYNQENPDDIVTLTGNLSTQLVFDTDGKLVNPQSVDLFILEGGTDPASTFGDEEGKIVLDMSGLTQYGEKPTGATAETANGHGPGNLSDISIGSDGKVTGRYTNGDMVLLAQISVAQFQNPAGLEKAGDSLFLPTANSGEFDGIGEDVQLSGGKIMGGVLEMSNVDMSQEFTEMITTQRGFQANSRIITTSDEMLQELVNLKR
jgi:flagellar hook protein FlgE